MGSRAAKSGEILMLVNVQPPNSKHVLRVTSTQKRKVPGVSDTKRSREGGEVRRGANYNDSQGMRDNR
jgi:hypothetical protein